jgi:GntR family transcriptional regulator
MAVRSAKEPIYRQLNGTLRGLIRSGEFAVGGRFLTERQVSERFGVSRATANKALSNLVAEGVLTFRKGVGTFVQGEVLGYDLRVLVSFTAKARAAGKRPATRVLRFGRSAAAAAPEARRALGVEGERELYHMERLRLADGLPVILERRHVVADLCPGLEKRALAGSLYALWTERYGLSIAGADQTIRAVVLRGTDAELLAVRSGTAGLALVSTGCVGTGDPLWYERTLYRGDAYEFHNRVGRPARGRPATGALLDVRHGRP